MSKMKMQYACQSCGAVHAKWSGRCDACGEWNTLVEEPSRAHSEKKRTSIRASQSSPHALSEIDSSQDARIRTGIGEIDRVLGGGIVPGSVVLLGGDPGIGKSTLMIQICTHLGSGLREGQSVLYVSGEESLRQIRLRAERLGILSPRVQVLVETDIDEILAAISSLRPGLVVIDSIQTMYRADLESAPGSVSQVRESTSLLLQRAKTDNIPMFIIGHVTKDGVIAGPRVLEHMVDTVLQFEGDQHHAFRIVRGMKNRFGSTNEIGIFEMQEGGLREVQNPSEVFLSERSREISGSCVCASIEGSRALLIEIQALVTPSNFGMPQRTVSGIDSRRLSLLLAVLEKRHGLRTGQYDVFANIAGGLRIDEPAIDLALATSIVSSLRDITIGPSTAVIGEVGLGGEVRSVGQIEKRINEAEKLGFKTIMIPRGNSKEKKRRALKIIEVESLSDAIRKLEIQ